MNRTALLGPYVEAELANGAGLGGSASTANGAGATARLRFTTR